MRSWFCKNNYNLRKQSQPLIIFAKRSIVHFWQGSEYASGSDYAMLLDIPMFEYAKILNVPGRVLNMPNLVTSTSFCYKRKAKKRPWNTSNTWLKFAQIEDIFFRINYEIRGRRYWKYQYPYSSKLRCFVGRATDKNKIKAYEQRATAYVLLGKDIGS